MSTKAFLVLIFVVLLTAIIKFSPSVYLYQGDPVILNITSMNGVSSGYTAGQNPVRGLDGSGLPWTVQSATGSLTFNGRLMLRVTGLVFDPDDQMVISKGLQGQNTIASFRGVISCRDIHGNLINVNTASFPATTGLRSHGGGDATIETQVDLPKPCLEPIVFITGPGDTWVATTPLD